jgi:putative two-component system response regulator
MKKTDHVVVADDLEANLDLIGGMLTRDGYAVHTAPDGEAALALIHELKPDLVISDVLMPRMSGFELCRRLKQDRATRLVPVVLVTSLGEREDRIEGINAGADDFLTKPVNPHELRARVRSLVRLKKFTDDLDSAESVILSLALTVEARDSCTGRHCERMAAYAAALGIQLDLPDEDIAALHRGGYLHDVGKVAVPDSILLKPGRLTAEEFEIMKRHTVAGEAVCGDLRLLQPVRPIVRSHHERRDGSGYPDGLSGDAIPLLAQIMGIVDVYDALTTKRPYRTPLSPAEACAELVRETDCGWRRRELVDEFINLSRSGRLQRATEGITGARPFAGLTI